MDVARIVCVCVCVCVGAHWNFQAHDKVRFWAVLPTVMHISLLTLHELKFISFTYIIDISWRHVKAKVQLCTFWYSHAKDIRVHVELCRICTLSSRKNRWWLKNVNFLGPRSSVDPVQCHTIKRGYWEVLSLTRKETSYSDQTRDLFKYSPRSSIHFLAHFSNFCKSLKKYSEHCPSNQVSAAGMTSASEEKWRPFNCFFSPGNMW